MIKSNQIGCIIIDKRSTFYFLDFCSLFLLFKFVLRFDQGVFVFVFVWVKALFFRCQFLKSWEETLLACLYVLPFWTQSLCFYLFVFISETWQKQRRTAIHTVQQLRIILCLSRQCIPQLIRTITSSILEFSCFEWWLLAQSDLHKLWVIVRFEIALLTLFQKVVLNRKSGKKFQIVAVIQRGWCHACFWLCEVLIDAFVSTSSYYSLILFLPYAWVRLQDRLKRHLLLKELFQWGIWNVRNQLCLR